MPLMTTFSVYNLARNNEFDYSKAQEELGYTTRSYEETIHDEVQWMIAEGLIDGQQRRHRKAYPHDQRTDPGRRLHGRHRPCHRT